MTSKVFGPQEIVELVRASPYFWLTSRAETERAFGIRCYPGLADEHGDYRIEVLRDVLSPRPSSRTALVQPAPRGGS
jgi:hypothetical protein